MQLKLNAKGNSKVPVGDRVFFYFIHNEQEFGMFYDKKVIVGKLIDLLLKEFGIGSTKNLNRVRLRLKCKDVFLENSLDLDQLLQNGIIENGSYIELVQGE